MKNLAMTKKLEIIKSVNKRHCFDRILNELELETLAEVGVCEGKFSQYLRDKASFLKELYLVDAWDKIPQEWVTNGNYKWDFSPKAQITHRLAVMAMFKDDRKVQVMNEFSVEAASMFEDGYLDFVYIDAQHEYEFVRDDINAWWPKVKPGAVLAGHDYSMLRAKLGVKQAVDEFVNNNDLQDNFHMFWAHGGNWIILKSEE